MMKGYKKLIGYQKTYELLLTAYELTVTDANESKVLKLLAKTSKPTSGTIKLKGRRMTE